MVRSLLVRALRPTVTYTDIFHHAAHGVASTPTDERGCQLVNPCGGGRRWARASSGGACRWLATSSGPRKKKPKSPSNKVKKRPSDPSLHTTTPKLAKRASSQSQTVPPACLLPTASPHAYIASSAAIELGIDLRSLFATSEVQSLAGSSKRSEPQRLPLPPAFRDSNFEYVSPKAFGHELPTFEVPEVAFLGRSNVGKSSLINALTRKELAWSSKRPGRTQQVNYFALVRREVLTRRGGGKVGHDIGFRPSDATGYLIDLPGYGYAKAPDEKVTTWQEMTQDFLEDRRDTGMMRRLFLLVDARHGATNFDRAVMGWLDEATIPYSVVLTKADRVGRPQVVRFVNDLCMRYHSQMYDEGAGYQGPVVHVTSARTGNGIRELMWSISEECSISEERMAAYPPMKPEGENDFDVGDESDSRLNISPLEPHGDMGECKER